MIKKAFLLFPLILLLFAPNHKTVLRVYDGDTILLNGKVIRLADIDAPERGMHYFYQSKEFLERLLIGKKVKIEEVGRDAYGRSVAYVYLDRKLVNLLMVKNGWAKFTKNKHSKYFEQFLKAEKEAKLAKKGIWKRKKYFCLSLIFHNNAKGNDKYNLNDEYFVLKNECNQTISLKDWSVENSKHFIFKFGNLSIKPYSKIVFRSGKGIPNKTDFFFNSSFPIWNNKKEEIIIRNEKGEIVISHSSF